MKCKRPIQLTVSLETELGLDLKSLLSGDSALKDKDKTSCFHTSQQREFTPSSYELFVLASSSTSEWRDAQVLARGCGVPLEMVLSPVDRGSLIGVQRGGRKIIETDAQLRETHWASQAAYFDYRTNG